MYSTIIHPTDLSDGSVPALKKAHELAKRFGSRLLVCFIARSPMIVTDFQITDPKTNETRDIHAEVAAIQPFDSEVNGEVKIISMDGSAGVKPVLDVLESMDAELLVLGMHRKKGFIGWFSKSITETVVKEAHTDVLVVKEGER